MKTEVCGFHNFSPFTYLSLPSFTSATAPSDPSNLTDQETTSFLLPCYLGAKESSEPRRSPQSCPDLPQQKTKWLRYHSPLLSHLPSTCQYFHFSTISLCYVMFRFAEVLFQVLDKRESSATWPFSAILQWYCSISLLTSFASLTEFNFSPPSPLLLSSFSPPCIQLIIT